MKIEKRIIEFEKMGFGLFVHYGLYSLMGKGEWTMHEHKNRKGEYKAISKKFKVNKNFAKVIVKAAKNAGCKYITFTTRHHDGFSLYDTKGLSDFDIMHTPTKRDIIKEFTHTFVKFLEKLKPSEYISTMTKSKRTGKIFVDYLRNQRTATAIGAYSTRARPHAPVSTPLAWDELSNRIEENSYTIKTLPKRLEQLKEDPWKEYWQIKQSLRLNEL